MVNEDFVDRIIAKSEQNLTKVHFSDVLTDQNIPK